MRRALTPGTRRYPRNSARGGYGSLIICFEAIHTVINTTVVVVVSLELATTGVHAFYCPLYAKDRLDLNVPGV